MNKLRTRYPDPGAQSAYFTPRCRRPARFNDGRFRVTTEAAPSTRSLRLHWPLAAGGVGRGYDRGEPLGPPALPRPVSMA